MAEAGRQSLQAFPEKRATSELMAACGGTVAPWTSAVRTYAMFYIGSLRGTMIPYFRSPVAGLPMVHWND